MDFISSALLLAGLGCLLMVILFAVWGFFAKFRRELTWTAVILVLLVLAWLIFGDAATLLNSKGAIVDLLAPLAKGDTSNCKTLWDVILQLGREMIPNGEVLLVDGKEAYDFFYSVVAGVLRGVGLIAITLVVFLVTPILRLITHIVWLIVRAVKKNKAAKAAVEATDEETPEETGEPTLSAEETVVITESDLGMDDVVVSVGANDAPKPWKYRTNVWGAILGALKGVAVIIILFAPIAGICSVLAEASPETRDAIADMMEGGSAKGNVSEEQESVADLLFGFVDSYYNSGIGKFVEGSAYFFGDSFSSITFDSALTIETKTQSIALREELISFIYAINGLNGKISQDQIGKWTISEIDCALENLKNSKLLVEIMPVAIEFLYEDQELLKIGLKDMLKEANQHGEFLELRYIDWDKDLETILDAVEEAYKLDIFAKDFNYLTMDPEVLVAVVDLLGDTELLNELLPIAVNTALRVDSIEKMIGTLEKNPDLTGINWKNDLIKFVGVYETFQELEITTLEGFNLDNFFRDVLRSDEKIDIVVEMLSEVASLDMFDQLLIPLAFNAATGNESLHAKLEAAGQVDNFNALKAIDWEKEMNAYAEAVKAAAKLFNPDEEKMIDVFALDTVVLKEVINKLCETESFELILNIGTCVVTHLEAVEKMIGDVDLVVNTNEINWNEDLLKVVDAYAQLPQLGFDSVEDFKQEPLALVADLLSDDARFAALEAAIDHILETSLVTTLIAPYGEAALNKVLVDAGFEQISGIIKLTSLTNQQWVEDVNSILELAKEAEALNVLSFKLAEMDLTSDEAINTIKDAVDTVLSLNLLGDDEVKNQLVEGLLNKYQLVSEYHGYENVVWENEKQVLINLVDSYAALIKLEGVDIQNAQFDFKALLNNDAFYDVVIDALDTLVDSELVIELLPDVLRTNVIPLVEAKLEDQGGLEGFLEGVTSDELLNALKDIISAVQDAKYIGLFDVAFDKAPLETLKLAEVDRIKNIVDVLLGNVIFRGHEGQILRIVLKLTKVIDKPQGYFDGIDFDAERATILNAIEKLKPILKDREFVLFVDSKLNLDYLVKDYFTNQLNLNILVNAVQQLVGEYEAEGTTQLRYSKLIELLLPDLYDKFVVEKNLIPADYQGLVDILKVDDLTGEQLLGDIRRIVYIAEQAVALNLQEFMLNGELLLDNQVLDNILDALADIHMFDGVGAEVIVWVADKFIEPELAKQDIALDITINDFEGVDLKAEVQPLKDVLHGISDFLVANRLTSVLQLKNLINNKAYLEAPFASEANGVALVNILTDVTELQTIELLLEVAFPVVLGKLKTEFDLSYWKEATFTGEQLAEDVRRILNITKLTVEETEIITYLVNDWHGDLNLTDEKVQALQTIVADLFELNLIKGFEHKLVESALKLALAKVEKVDVASFKLETIEDWSVEVKMIQDVIGLVPAVFEENNILTLDDVKMFIDKKLYLDYALVKDANLAFVADLLAILSNSKLVGNAIVAVMPLLPDPILKSEFGNISVASLQNVTAEEFQADLLTLSTMLDTLLPIGLVEIYENKLNTNVNLTGDALSIVADVIDMLPELNIVNKCFVQVYTDVLNYALGMAYQTTSGAFPYKDFTITAEDVEGIDYELGLSLITEALREAKDVFVELDIQSVSGLLELFDKEEKQYADYSLWTEAVVLEVEEVVRPLINLQTIGLLVPTIGKFVAPMLDKVNLPLAFVKYYLEVEYTPEELTEDLNVALDIALEAYDAGALEYLLTKDIKELTLVPVANILGLVQELNIVNALEAELLEVVLNKVFETAKVDNKFALELEDLQNVDYVNEFALLQQAVLELDEALAASEFVSLADVMSFVETKNYLDYSYYNTHKEIVYNALEAVAVISDLELLALVTPQLVVVLKDIADNAGFNIDFLEISNEEFADDIKAITDIAADAVELNVLNLIKYKELENINMNLLAEIVGKVLALNILEGQEAEWAAAGVNKLTKAIKLNATVEAEDFDIDWEAEKLAIVELVKLAGQFLKANNINSYPGVIEFVKGDEFKNAEFWTNNENANAEYAVEIVQSVLELQLAECILPLALSMVFTQLDNLGYPMVFMEEYFANEYTGELLVEDAQVLANILLDAVEFGALEYVFTKEISELDLAIVAEIITNVYELHFIQDNMAELFAYAANVTAILLGETGYAFDEADFDHIDFAQDFENLAAAVEILDVIVTDFGLTSLSSLMAFFKNSDFLDVNIYTEECADNLLQTLSLLVDVETAHLFLPLGAVAAIKAAEKADIDLSFLTGLTSEELAQDLDTVLAIAQKALDIAGYEFINTSEVEYIDFEGVNEIIALVDEINVLNKYASEWALIVANLLNKQLPVKFNAKALEDINWSLENEALRGIVSQVAEFLRHENNTELDKVDNLVSFINNKEFLQVKFWTRNYFANVRLVADILDSVLDMQIADAMTGYGIDFAIYATKGNMNLAFLSSLSDNGASVAPYDGSYSAELLQQDLHTLMAILDELQAFGLAEILSNSIIDDFDFDYIENAIALLEEINLIELAEDEWVALAINQVAKAMKLDLTVKAKDLAYIDWSNENKQLRTVVNAISEALFEANLNGYDEIASFITNKSYANVNFYSEEILVEVLEAVRELVKLEAVQLALNPLLNKAIEIADKQKLDLSFLADALTNDELVADVNEITYAVEALLQGDLLDTVKAMANKTEVDLVIADLYDVADALDHVAALNLLAGKRFASVIKSVLNKLEVSTTKVDLSSVTIAEEVANIKQIIRVVDAFAFNWNLETVLDIKEVNFKDAHVYFLHQEAQLSYVNEILEIVKNDELIAQILFPLLDKYMPANTSELADLPGIYRAYSLLAADITKLQTVIELIISLDLEAVFNNEIEIPWNEVDTVKGILNNLLGTRYLSGPGREQAIVDALGKFFDTSSIDGSAIDLESDAIKFGELYGFIANILTDDDFSYHTVHDFKAVNFDLGVLFKESSIENLKAAAKKYMETTIFDQTGFLVLLLAVPAFKAALPEYYELLLGDVSQDQFTEDFEDLFNAALAIRDTGLQNIASTDLAVVEENALEALELIMNTTVFNGKFEALAKLVLKDFVNGKQLGYVNFADVQLNVAGLDADLETLVNEILPALFDLLEALGVETLAEIKSAGNLNTILNALAKQENFDTLENVLEDLTNLSVLRNNVSDLYDEVIYPLVADKTGFAWELLDLFFYGSQEQLLEDLDAVVAAVKELNSLGLSSMIADHVNGTDNYVIDYTRSEITNALSLIANTNYFAEKQQLLAEKLLGAVDYIDYSKIDFADDYNNYFEPAYEKLAVVLNELGYEKVSALKALIKNPSSINWKPIVSDYVLGTQTIEALELLSGSAFLYEVAPVMLVKVSELSSPLAKFADPEGLSKDELKEDYDNLLIVAQAALDFIYNEGQHVRTGKNISIENVEKAILALETAWNLNILEGKYAELAHVVTEKLELGIALAELEQVDWANELPAVSAMLEKALQIANNYGLHTAREVKAYLQTVKGFGKKELIKEAYRLFMRDNYEYTVEFVEALADSELAVVAVLPLYNKLTAGLTGNIAELLDLSAYNNTMLEQDLDLVANVARNAFDANIYQSYVNGATLDATAEPYIAEILTDLFALNILDVKAQDAFDLVASLITFVDLSSADVSSIDWNADGLVYAAQADEFVTLFNEVVLNFRATLGTLDVLGNAEVVEAVMNLYDAFVTTELGNKVAYFVVAKLGPIVAKVDADSPLVNADQALAVEFLRDLAQIVDAFVNMGFFGNGAHTTIDLAAADGLTILVDLLEEYTNGPAKLYEYLDKAIARVYAVGTFELDYSGISTKQEAKHLISIAKSALQLARNYAGRVAAKDFAVVTEAQFQNDLTTLVSKVADDAVFGQLLLPLSRGAARMLATALGGFELFEDQTEEEFNANLVNVYLPEVYELLGYAEELGVFNRTIKYKDTETLMDLVDFLATAELSKDNLTPVLRYLLAKLNVLTPELDAKIEAINWLDEATMGNAFLAKFKYALNVPGVQITKLDTLKNNEFIALAADALAELENSYLLETLGRTLAIRLYDKVLGGRLQFVKELLSDANYTDADFVEDYATVLEMVDAIIALDYFSAGSLMGKLDNKLPNTQYAIEALAEKAITLNIIADHEQELVEKVLSKVSFLNGVTVDYSLIADWSLELATLADATAVIANFIETYESEIGKVVKVDELAFEELINANVKAAFLDVVDQIALSVIGQAAFKEVYNSMIKPMIEDAQPDFVEVLDLETLDPSQWANELSKLLTIYDAVDGVISGGNIAGTFAQLADIMAQLFGLNSYEGLVAVKANPKKYLDIIIDYLPASMTQGLTIDSDAIYDQAQAGTALYNEAYIAEAETYYELLMTLDLVFGGTVSGLDFGTIDTKTWQEIASVLVAVNNSKTLRGILVQVIGDTISDMGGTGDVNITDLVSDGFWTQYDNESYNEAFWAGSELVYIAQILALSKELGMSSLDLGSVELGTGLADIDPLNPAAFDVNNAGFKQLLQLVALTNTLDITTLGGTGILYSYIVTSQGLLSSTDIATFGAMPAGAAAFEEIENIINVLEETKALSGSMSTAMVSKSTVEIADLLKAIIASSVMKSVLPVLVNKTIEEESVSSTPDSVSIDAFISDEYSAINWASATPAQWAKYWSDAQIELLAKLVKLSHELGAEAKLFDMKLGLGVSNAQNISVATFDIYLSTAGLYSLLQLINYVELFDITALQGTSGVINKAVQAHNSLEPGKALGTLPASATKAEWDAEIYAIISAIDTINNLVGTSGAISMDDKLAELVQTDSDAVKDFLHLVNSSTILREMLPQMMYDSLETALTVALTPLYGVNAGAHAATIMNTTSNATIVWMRGQLGDSNPTASVAEWDAQIDTICAILADPSIL